MTDTVITTHCIWQCYLLIVCASVLITHCISSASLLITHNICYEGEGYLCLLPWWLHASVTSLRGLLSVLLLSPSDNDGSRECSSNSVALRQGERTETVSRSPRHKKRTFSFLHLAQMKRGGDGVAGCGTERGVSSSSLWGTGLDWHWTVSPRNFSNKQKSTKKKNIWMVGW